MLCVCIHNGNSGRQRASRPIATRPTDSVDLKRLSLASRSCLTDISLTRASASCRSDVLTCFWRRSVRRRPRSLSDLAAFSISLASARSVCSSSWTNTTNDRVTIIYRPKSDCNFAEDIRYDTIRQKSLTLWRPLLYYGYSCYKASGAIPD